MPDAPSRLDPLVGPPCEPPLRRARSAVTGLLASTPLLAGQAAPALEASAGATEGHVQLSWTPAEAGEELVFEVQTSTNADFEDAERCYLGPERASFRSGLGPGDHYFRVRERTSDASATFGPWSRPVQVEMAFHPLRAAWALFAVGATLVGSIVGFLVVAERRARRSEDGA